MHLAQPDAGLPGSSAIVAGTIPLAVGSALAFAIKGRDTVSVAFFGDGAVNEGAFYEALNFASLKRVPVVFVCENNLYSTHMPIAACLAATDIYKKAEAFCMPGVRVDGNDVVEVYQIARKAIEDARTGGGPTLVECMTYRWRGHVGPNYDLDKGLRSREEFETWTAKCPLRKMEEALLVQGVVSLLEIAQMYEDIQREVDEAFLFAKESPYPAESELLTDVFQTP